MADEELLAELDRIARDFDHYECGLPWSDEPQKLMIEAVRKFRKAAGDAAVNAHIEAHLKAGSILP